PQRVPGRYIAECSSWPEYPSASKEELKPGDGEYEYEENISQCTGATQIKKAKRHLPDVVTKGQRRNPGSAICHDKCLLKDLECTDSRYHQNKEHHRRKERQRDMPEAVPGVRSIQACSLVIIPGNA